MGRIFPTEQPRAHSKRPFVSHRKAQYLQAVSGDRNKVEKHEQKMQIVYCDWFRETFPGIHFRSDTGAGAFNSEWEKATHNRQQSSPELPDFEAYAARRGFHLLMIEFKADGVSLRMKRDGHKIRVKTKKVPISKKHPTGIKVIERDYKIRLKGDWASLHIEKQHDRMVELRKEGICAVFGEGLEASKKITCWYFDKPYIENNTLEF